MNLQEARLQWAQHRGALEAKGIILPDVVGYAADEAKHDYTLAMDAMPAISTASNSAVPWGLTNYIDPEVIRFAFAPVKAAKILDEQKKGTWLDDTIMFHVVEHTGEVSSYGDFNTNGRSGVNTNWPQRQSYHFQIMKEYGEREIERAGLSRLNWVGEIDMAAADNLARFSNYTYFFGVAGLQNYGLLNDPNLPASLTPATKAHGGVTWMNGNAIIATANEIYNDIVAMFSQLVSQTGGLVEQEDSLVLAMSPASAVALTATNSFNVNVSDLLKKNYPNIRIETAVQYGVVSSSNPHGIAGGNLVQMHAEKVDGQNTGFLAYTEKMRAHKIVPDVSSFKQKVTSGTWGAIIAQPNAFASMLGV
jgi:hypothetical protein